MSQLNDYKLETIRSAAILTGSYVAGTVIDTHLMNQLILYVDFTKGSLTTAELKIEFSPDGTNYYQETVSAISSGVSTDDVLVHQYDGDGAYRIPLEINDRYVKVSVKGTGTVTSSSMAVKAVIGNN